MAQRFWHAGKGASGPPPRSFIRVLAPGVAVGRLSLREALRPDPGGKEHDVFMTADEPPTLKRDQRRPGRGPFQGGIDAGIASHLALRRADLVVGYSQRRASTVA